MAKRSEEAKALFRATMEKKKETSKVKINEMPLRAVTANIVYEEYFDMNDWQQKLFTNSTAIEWAKELIEFCKRPDVLKATDFFIDKGIEYTEAMRLCATYEVMGKAYAHSRYIVGSRREKGGIRNEYNAGLIHSSMSMYDPE